MLKTKILKPAALIVCLLVATTLLFAGCGDKTAEGEKDITVSIVLADGSSQAIDINTDKEYLADALVQEGIIEYDESGYYTCINGVTADYNADKSWWCLTKDGAMTTEGLNTQPIQDGDKFELTYKVD